MYLRFILLGVSLTACAFCADQNGVAAALKNVKLPGIVQPLLRKDKPVLTASALPGTCAHIIVIRPAEVDSKMVVPLPQSSGDSMPLFKGMPACREDVRQAR
jgi:hypothetical protein